MFPVKYVKFFLQCKIQSDIFRIDFFPLIPDIFLFCFFFSSLGNFKMLSLVCHDVEQFVSIGAFSAEKTLLLFCPFTWRRGTQRQQTDKHLLHCISARDPFPRHRLLSASSVAAQLQPRLVPSKLSEMWQHLRRDLHPHQSEWLMSVTGYSSILCALSKNIWVDFMSSSLVPISVCNSHSGYVGAEKQASPEMDHPKALGWISPHNCCFLPLTKDDELKFQHRQNPWDLGDCLKGCPVFAQPTSVKSCYPQKHLWRIRKFQKSELQHDHMDIGSL